MPRRNRQNIPIDNPPPNPTLFRRQILIAGESEQEFSALYEQWRREYRPDSPNFEQEVLRAAEADWLLRREQQQHDRAERRIFRQVEDLSDWSAEQHKSQRELGRRVDRAQRELLRARNAVEQLRRSRLSEKIRLENHEMRTARHRNTMKQSQASQKAQSAAKESPSEEKPKPVYPRGHILGNPEDIPYVQIVTIRIEDGVTVTTPNPPNDDMLRMLQASDRPDKLVRRVLSFRNGIPPEYAWVLPVWEIPEENRSEERGVGWELSQEEFEYDAQYEAEVGGPHIPPNKDMEVPPEFRPVREVVLLG